LPNHPEADRFAESLTADGRYRLLVNAVTDYAIYMLDMDGIVSSWNAGARRFKGYEEAEIVGQHFSRFYTPEDRATGLPEILGSLELVRRRVTEEPLTRLIDNAIRGAQRGQRSRNACWSSPDDRNSTSNRSTFRCWCAA
jgi:PAS domain-containing protein